MRLVIAEKPTVARAIAQALGCSEKHDGYIRGDGYTITWVFGHLVGIAEPEEMNDEWAKWSIDTLPIVPAEWKHVVLSDPDGHRRKQFLVIKKLLHSPEVTDVVCATDAGREGELIFRLIYQHAEAKKPCYRLWISTQTDTAVREGFRTLKPSSLFDDLAASAAARSRADWLVGMNASRLYTCLNRAAGGDGTFHVGRVKTPTLALVVRRDRAIDGFVSKAYYEVHAVLEPGFTARWIKGGSEPQTAIPEKTAAEQIVADIAPVPTARATKVDTKDVRTPPPQLHDLVTLQKEANRRYGYTADHTLALAQSLYEKQLISYPRTESRHLSEDLVPTLPAIARALAGLYPEASARALKRLASGEALGKAYVDDNKLTDHHALIPTDAPLREGAVTEEERTIYDMIATRFLSIFYPPLVRTVTVALFEIGMHTFRANGTVVKDPGWTVVPGHGKAPEPLASSAKGKTEEDQGEGSEEDEPDASQGLPPIVKDERYAKRSQALVERHTQPPKPYTDGTLLDAMTAAGRLVDDKRLAACMKERGLGTGGTRGPIIRELVEGGYLVRKMRAIHATPRGVALVDRVHPDLADPVLTARWEQLLGEIEDGKYNAQKFETEIVVFVREVMAQAKTARTEAVGSGAHAAIGSCPACKSGAVRSVKGDFYGCSRWKEGCKFSLPGTLCRKKLSPAQIQALLTKGRTTPIKGFTSKAGKKFDASLKLNAQTHRLEFVFAERAKAPAA